MQAPEVFKKIFMFVDLIVIVRHMGNLTNKSLQRELTDFDVHSLPSFLNCYLKKKKRGYYLLPCHLNCAEGPKSRITLHISFSWSTMLRMKVCIGGQVKM